MEERMSRIDRRNMLKVMAATAAGAAASATGIEQAFAAGVHQSTDPTNPFGNSSTLQSPASAIRTPLATNLHSLNHMGQDFKPSNSTFTYTQGASIGSIQAVAGPSASYYRSSVDLPNGSVVMQVLFDLIVNDANAASVFFNGYNPETGVFAPVLSKTVITTNPAIQTVDMLIPPTTIDSINNAYALYWFPGTNGATHQLYGARVAWMLSPGLTLFPNPRRVVDGFVTPFTSGVTYGPFDATLKSGGGASGVPAGATAAFCAVQSYSVGVLTIFPDLTTDPNIANFTAVVDGTLNLTYMMVPLSPAGKFKIDSHITGRVFVDVWGFVV
jgi:hypothetical protein